MMCGGGGVFCIPGVGDGGGVGVGVVTAEDRYKGNSIHIKYLSDSMRPRTTM